MGRLRAHLKVPAVLVRAQARPPQGGGSTTTSTSGTGASNSSRTSIISESKGRFWETLENNIRDILAETDKEVMIARSGSGGILSATQKDANGAQDADAQFRSNTAERNEFREEYKTYFAATVISNREAGIISVRGTSKQHEKVQEFLDKVMNSVKRQVLIEATIVEVQLNDSFQSGVDWARLSNPGSSSGFQFGQVLGSRGFIANVDPVTGAVSPAPGDKNVFGATPTAGFIAAYLNPVSSLGNIAASITLLKQFGDTKVLSSPKLMVLNNQTAVLKVVNNLVYFTVQAQQTPGSTTTQPFTTITTTPNTVPVGMVMSVTPQINDRGNVNINVRPSISSRVGEVEDPNPVFRGGAKNAIPIIQVREMESVLQIESGSTAILGGLMQDEIFKRVLGSKALIKV